MRGDLGNLGGQQLHQPFAHDRIAGDGEFIFARAVKGEDHAVAPDFEHEVRNRTKQRPSKIAAVMKRFAQQFLLVLRRMRRNGFLVHRRNRGGTGMKTLRRGASPGVREILRRRHSPAIRCSTFTRVCLPRTIGRTAQNISGNAAGALAKVGGKDGEIGPPRGIVSWPKTVQRCHEPEHIGHRV
jgi:hypothetical protein